MSFSPDGRWLAVAAIGGTTTVYQRDPFENAGTVKGTYAVFSPDGKVLATADKDVIVLWDVATRKEVKHFPGLPYGAGLVYSPDGRWLVEYHTTPQSQTLLWRTGEEHRQPITWRLPTWVYTVAFSPEGRHLATANGNNTVYIFRLAPPPAEARQP
jgi:WD40 repeat protein